MRIVTPLDVYRRLALRYRALGVIAANAQGLSGIEKVLLEANPALDLLGACALPVVLAVEAGMPPEELVERYRLAALAAWFADGGMEALVLGCTHFPYFKEALAARTRLPLVDPAEMLRLLTHEESGPWFFHGPLYLAWERSPTAPGAVRRPGLRGARRRLPAAPGGGPGPWCSGQHHSRPIWMGTTSSTSTISTSQAAKDREEREKNAP
ncbi:MAG: aspartate/glutamate racemase family protein [Dysosmobacter welbionis]